MEDPWRITVNLSDVLCCLRDTRGFFSIDVKCTSSQLLSRSLFFYGNCYVWGGLLLLLLLY